MREKKKHFEESNSEPTAWEPECRHSEVIFSSDFLKEKHFSNCIKFNIEEPLKWHL